MQSNWNKIAERVKSFALCKRAAAALEFSLTVIPLFLFICGTIEFGLIWHVSSLVEESTHYAARLGRTGNSYKDLNPDNLDRDAFFYKVVKDRLGNWVSEPDQLKIEAVVVGDITNLGNAEVGGLTTGGGGEAVVYNITFNWKLLMPFIGNIIGDNGNFQIVSKIPMVNEDF